MPRTRPKRSAGGGGRAATAVVGLLSAALAVIGLQLPTATPASAASSGSAAAVRQCADPKPGHVTCLSLHRTDVAARRGVQVASATPAGIGATDLRGAYALPADGGAGQTVAIVDAYDDPTAEADLAVYRQQYGLPACTTANGCFTKVDQRGGTNYPAPNASWAGEISLDLDMVSAAAPNAHILLVEADSTSFADMGAAVDEAVALGAKYVSNSYGTGYNSTPGTGEDPAEATQFDPHYNHPGVAMVASSGDSGYGVGYPAASQYVTAVGGTSLARDSSARGWSESVWSGAGSGCSLYETKPAWQSDSGCDKRAVADVAAVADPATGVAVYDSYQQGGWNVYGGTSASAPIIAGVYAAAGTPAKDTYPSSYPYANPGHLNDVTAGSNGTCSPAYLCTAGAGYDGPTGLGTPNGVDAFTTGPHGAVTGTVTDASTKAPVAGATVTVGDSTALTDASGHYRTSAPVGTYDATASAYGYADKTVKGVTVTDGGSVTEDFALDTVPSSTVSGKVTDGSGHSWPLYATISVDGVPGGPVHTDPYTGSYSLKLPQGHTYTLSVNANYPGYEAVTKKVTLGSSDTTADLSVPVDVYDCIAPGYKAHNTGTTQTFDGTSTPDGWTLKNTPVGAWAFNDPKLTAPGYSQGNHTGGSGNFAVTNNSGVTWNNLADMSLVSPVADFSDAAHPVVSFNTDFHAFLSTADVDVTTDGGATWKNAWHRSTDLRGPAPVDVPLPMAAHQSAVQVRFHYTGGFSSSGIGTWWQVDDAFIGDRTCDPVAGGLVAGTVTDANTDQPVVGATVTSADKPADHAMTAATPDDPNLPDGFYSVFSSLIGTHDFTAARRHYATATAHVDVAADAVTRTPFALKAGRITVTPGKVDLSVPWQGKTAQTVTVKNTGSAPAKVTFDEHAGGVTPLIAHGAPTTRIKGSYSPLPLVGKGASNRKVSGAAPHGAVPADAPWTAIADYLPGPVVDNAVVSLGGKIYSAFGTSTADFYRGMYVYDPTAGTWSRVAGPADGRQKPAMAVLNGKIYATGGWGSTGAPDGKTEVYDPAADAWTTAAANPRPLAGSGTAVLDGKMYVVGGCDTDCGATGVMAYDPATDSWSRHADYPEAVSWEACGTLYGELYCAGGTGPGGETRHAYVYDPAADSWSRAADLPIELWGSGYTTAEGRLLVSGGVTQDNTAITNQGFSYDPAGDTWAPMANSNNAVYRGGSACGFYKIGGVGKDEYGDLVPVAGAEVLPGVSDCGDGNDVSWLAAKPKTVTVAPGASATVTVSVDASAPDITQPGTYTAKFAIGTDTPYSTPVLPVSMTVAPPKTWGKITGVVTGSAGPLPGAVVQVTTSGAHYTLVTDASGRYQLWVDAQNPLQVICADDGYQSQMATVRIRKGATTTLNFALQKV